MSTGVFSIPLPGSNRAAGGTSPRALPAPSDGQRVGAIVEEFIAGPENHLLVAVAKELALDNRSTGHCLTGERCFGNPLVLCGPAGSGKTHLALGLAEIWKQHDASRRIRVVVSEQLSRSAARAALPGEMPTREARQPKLNEADCLLVIEDVHRLPTTPTAQRNLRSLLDEAVAKNRRVIVTAVDIPGSLDSLAHDLRSRLAGGLTVCVSKPARETRTSIINAYAESYSVSFTESAVDLLSRSFETTAGTLVVAVKEIISWLPKQDKVQTIDTNLVQRYLEESSVTHCLTISRFAALVAKHFHTTVAELRGRSRRRGISATRNVLMYLVYKQGRHSLASIGKYLGGRDHTTILHGCRNIERQLLRDPTIQHKIGMLSEMIAEEKLAV